MNSCDIWNELAETYFRTNEPDKALEAYTRAIDLGIKNGKTYTNAAALHVKAGQFALAVSLYQKSMELLTNPAEIAENLVKLGSVYHKLNEHGKAIQAYQKSSQFSALIKPEKNDKPTANDLGQALQDQSSRRSEFNLPESSDELTREHSDLFEAALQTTDPAAQENPAVWNELGLVLFKVGAYEDAIDAYKKAIDLDPKSGYFYSNLGQVLVSQGRLTDAMEIFEYSIKLLPGKLEKAVSWTRLSDIYRQLGKNEEAAAALKMTEILNQSAQLPANDFRFMKVEQIALDADEVRNQESLDELVSSIRIYGIIQPLVVCPSKKEAGKYQVIVGKRRLAAARRLDIAEVPVLLRQASEQEMIELSMNENLHQCEMSKVLIANNFRQMQQQFDLSIPEISVRIGMPIENIQDALSPAAIPGLADMEAFEKIEDLMMQPAGETQSDYLDHYVSPVHRNDEYDEYAGMELNTVRSMKAVHTDATPALWYLENESEKIQSETNYQDNSTLIGRARHALKCNPHARRLWASASVQA